MGKKARDRSLDIKGQCSKTAFNIALVKVKVTQSCDSLRPHGLLWNSPGQNTGVGSLSLLERIFTIQGSNPGLPNCRQILYQLSHKGTPKDTRECWILLCLTLKIHGNYVISIQSYGKYFSIFLTKAVTGRIEPIFRSMDTPKRDRWCSSLSVSPFYFSKNNLKQ